MGPILLIVVLLGIMVGFIVWTNKASYDDNCGQFIGAVFASIAALVVIIWWPCSYFGSVGEIADMRAFSRDTLSSYEYTISATQEIEISASEVGLVDVAYLGQGQSASERIKELRDKAEWFNSRLERNRTFNGFWFVKDLIADAPADLVPIRITK